MPSQHPSPPSNVIPLRRPSAGRAPRLTVEQRARLNTAADEIADLAREIDDTHLGDILGRLSSRLGISAACG